MIKATLLTISTCGILFSQTVASQQSSADPANGPENHMFVTGGIAIPGAPGAAISIVDHESSFVSGKPVTGAPYSADQVTEHVQTLADGNRIVNTTTMKIYRDSRGRTRTETTLPTLPGGMTAPAMITIHDPVAGVTYLLNSESKSAQKMIANPIEVRSIKNASALPPLPPLPPGAATGQIVIGAATSLPKADVQTQDLGSQTIDGLAVTGTRTTSTIPAGAIGNEQPIETVSERWFSPALQVVVKSVNTDPRIGQTSEKLTNVSRSEPDASLFQVPSDYTITDSKKPEAKMFFYRTEQ